MERRISRMEITAFGPYFSRWSFAVLFCKERFDGLFVRCSAAFLVIFSTLSCGSAPQVSETEPVPAVDLSVGATTLAEAFFVFSLPRGWATQSGTGYMNGFYLVHNESETKVPVFVLRGFLDVRNLREQIYADAAKGDETKVLNIVREDRGATQQIRADYQVHRTAGIQIHRTYQTVKGWKGFMVGFNCPAERESELMPHFEYIINHLQINSDRANPPKSPFEDLSRLTLLFDSKTFQLNREFLAEIRRPQPDHSRLLSLLEQGADPNAFDTHSALLLAADAANLPLMTFLAEHGASAVSGEPAWIQNLNPIYGKNPRIASFLAAMEKQEKALEPAQNQGKTIILQPPALDAAGN